MDEIQTLERDIADEIQSLDNRVHNIAATSQRRYRMDAMPGTAIPDFGEFQAADDEGRAAIRDACQSAYRSVMRRVDMRIASVNSELTESARADDVATVTLTLSRENVTRGELQALLDKYRNNYQMAAAIVERAHKADMFLDGEPYALRVYREDADSKAREVVAGRHGSPFGGAFVGSPDMAASSVVSSLHHVDMFGRAY